MAAVGGRVDQPAAARRRRRGGCPAQRSPWSRAGGSSAASNALEVARRDARAASIAASGSARASRASRASGQQPVRRVELGPRRARLVGQPAAAGGAAVLAAEARRAGRWRRGQRGAELGARCPGGPAALVDPLEHEVVRRRRPTPRAPRARRSRRPRASHGQAGGLGREELRRRARVRLGEHPPPVVEVDAYAIATSPPRTGSQRTIAAPSDPLERGAEPVVHPRGSLRTIGPDRYCCAACSSSVCTRSPTGSGRTCSPTARGATATPGWSPATGPSLARRHALRPAADPGDARLDARRSPTGAPIDTVVNTHANGDHCYGNQLVRDARIVASDAAAGEMDDVPPPLLHAFKQLDIGDDGNRFVADAFGPFRFDDIESVPPTDTFTRLDDDRRRRPDRAPSRRSGRRTRWATSSPGCPTSDVVFTGDILFHGSHPDHVGRSRRQLDRGMPAHPRARTCASSCPVTGRSPTSTGWRSSSATSSGSTAETTARRDAGDVGARRGVGHRARRVRGLGRPGAHGRERRHDLRRARPDARAHERGRRRSRRWVATAHR